MAIINKLRTILGTCIVMVTIGYAAPASAQATRTWVSGVGDDVNPCSRTAPCKTFAGAISKTAAGGEINCLDPGGFGAVTITKSITIDCTGTIGSTLASLTNGIVINDALTATPNTIRVILRGLSINGAPPNQPGLNGIRFLSGASLVVENVIIQNFTTTSAGNGFGISFRPGGAASLYVTNTTIVGNGNGSNGGGILIQPTGAAGSGRVLLENVRLENNAGVGIRLSSVGNTSTNPTLISIDRSHVAGSPIGIAATTTLGNSSIEGLVNRSTLFNNVTGINADGSAVSLRVSGTTVMNTTAALAISNSAIVRSFGDNIMVEIGQAPSPFTPPTQTKS